MKSVIKDVIRSRPIPEAKLGETEADRELREIWEKARIKIKVIGVGGAGSNTVTRFMQFNVEGVETLAVNTDVQHLLLTKANDKLLIGKTLCGGIGAGGDYVIGEEAAKESLDDIKKKVEGTDLVFITCGLGGGTGTGASHIIARVAREQGALVIALATLPFTVEGKARREAAIWGLERLSKVTDTLIIIPNDKILEIARELPLSQAFLVSDEILARAIQGIAEMLLKPGLINVDFADLRTVIEGGGPALISFGESDSNTRASDAVRDALNNPLLDVDISGARGALINISCGPDISLEEVEEVVESIVGELDPDAVTIWGARIKEELKGMIQVLLIVVGVTSPYIVGYESEIEGEIKGTEGADVTGIEEI